MDTPLHSVGGASATSSLFTPATTGTYSHLFTPATARTSTTAASAGSSNRPYKSELASVSLSLMGRGGQGQGPLHVEEETAAEVQQPVVQAKREAVNNWLRTLYHGRNVPRVDEEYQSVEVMYDLMLKVRKRTQQAQELQADADALSQEYAAERERIGQVLAIAGLDPSVLSQSGRASLDTLSSLACALGLKNARTSSFFAALVDLQMKSSEMDKVVSAAKKTSSDLRAKTQLALQELNATRRWVDLLAAEAPAKLTACTHKRRALDGYRAKRRDYRHREAQFKAKVAASGVDSRFTHASIVGLVEQKDAIVEQTRPLRTTLKAFHDLPPDIPLARQKLADARALVEQLDTQVDHRIHCLDD